MAASLTRKSCASISRPSAGIRLPADRRITSPGTICVTGRVSVRAVPQNAGRQGEALLQFLDSGRGPILLQETEQRTAQHDGQDDAGINPLL